MIGDRDVDVVLCAIFTMCSDWAGDSGDRFVYPSVTMLSLVLCDRVLLGGPLYAVLLQMMEDGLVGKVAYPGRMTSLLTLTDAGVTRARLAVVMLELEDR